MPVPAACAQCCSFWLLGSRRRRRRSPKNSTTIVFSSGSRIAALPGRYSRRQKAIEEEDIRPVPGAGSLNVSKRRSPSIRQTGQGGFAALGAAIVVGKG